MTHPPVKRLNRTRALAPTAPRPWRHLATRYISSRWPVPPTRVVIWGLSQFILSYLSNYVVLEVALSRKPPSQSCLQSATPSSRASTPTRPSSASGTTTTLRLRPLSGFPACRSTTLLTLQTGILSAGRCRASPSSTCAVIRTRVESGLRV